MDGAFLGKNLSGRDARWEKTIDRAALHVLSALGLYLCFVSALGHVWLAAGCALVALLLLRKLLMPLAGRLPKREARKGRARAEVERWAMLDACAAEAEARALLEKAYPGQAAEADVVFLAAPPAGAAPWTSTPFWTSGAGGGGEKLLLITTARADAAALSCAAKLAHPAVCLIDGARLGALLTSFPPPERAEEKKGRAGACASPFPANARRAGCFLGFCCLACICCWATPSIWARRL